MLKNKSKSHHELLAVLQQNHLALLNSGENEFDGLEEETDHYLFTIGLGEKHLIDFHDTFFKKTGTLVRLPWLGKTIDLLNEIIQRIQFVYLLRNAENMQTSGLGEGNDIKNRISDLYFLLIINAGKDSIKVRFVDFRDECEFVDLQKIKILTAQNSLVEKDLPLNFNEHIKDFDGMYSITAREAGGKKSSEVEILLNNTLEEHEVIPEKVIYRGVKIFWNNFIRGSYTHDSFLMQLGLSERHLKDFTDSLESVYFKKNDLTWLIKKEKRIFNLIQRITLNAQNRSIDMIYENIKEKNFDQPLLYITVGMFFKKQVELIRTIHLDFYIIQCTGIFPLEKNYYSELVELDFFNREESDTLRLEKIPIVFDPVHQEYVTKGLKLNFNDDIDKVVTRIKAIGGTFSTYKIFLKHKVRDKYREEYTGIFTKIRFVD